MFKKKILTILFVLLGNFLLGQGLEEAKELYKMGQLTKAYEILKLIPNSKENSKEYKLAQKLMDKISQKQTEEFSRVNAAKADSLKLVANIRKDSLEKEKAFRALLDKNIIVSTDNIRDCKTYFYQEQVQLIMPSIKICKDGGSLYEIRCYFMTKNPDKFFHILGLTLKLSTGQIIEPEHISFNSEYITYETLPSSYNYWNNTARFKVTKSQFEAIINDQITFLQFSDNEHYREWQAKPLLSDRFNKTANRMLEHVAERRIEWSK